VSELESTKETIARLALELFTTKGYAGTSVRDIAEAMGLTKAGVGYHFPAKEDLLHYVVDPVLDAVEEVVDRAAHLAPASPRGVLAAYLAVLLEHRMEVGLIVSDPAVVHHPVLGPSIDEQHRRLRALLVGSDAEPANDLRAAAALGALQRPVVAFPGVEPGEVEHVVLDAAMAVLAEVSAARSYSTRRPRRPRRPRRA
jgi:AcrR family transcriptional regulator